MTLYECYVLVIGALVVIITTTAMMPYHFVKSLALIWRLVTRKIHLLIPDLQVTGSYLTSVRGYLDNIASNGRQVTRLFFTCLLFDSVNVRRTTRERVTQSYFNL